MRKNSLHKLFYASVAYFFISTFDNGWTKEKDINTAIKDARENTNQLALCVIINNL